MKESFSENIVIGNGIMAKQLMFKLQEKFSDITCIASDDFAPACSLRTTAVTCLRGTKRDVSPLGNLILDSYKCFESFFENEKPHGITKSVEVQTWIENDLSHAKWLRRYGQYSLTNQQMFHLGESPFPLATVNTEAYLVAPEKLYAWYLEQLSKVSYLDDFVYKIDALDDGYQLFLKSGNSIKCKRLFLCTSYMSHLFIDLCEKNEHKEQLKKQKAVYGNYLHYKLKDDNFNLDLRTSFCLSYEFIRMIYRKESHELVISFPDTNKNAFINDKGLLANSFNEFKEKLGLVALPELEQFTLIQGIRSKGHRRIPFCERINKNLFCASGLYKNAFTFAYLFSEKVTNSIFDTDI